MIALEQFYTEASWKAFIKVFKKDQQTSPEELILKNLLHGNKHLARVIFEILGHESLNWINEKVPALDNLKPVECLTNDDLKKRLKVCLMRMYK